MEAAAEVVGGIAVKTAVQCVENVTDKEAVKCSLTVDNGTKFELMNPNAHFWAGESKSMILFVPPETTGNMIITRQSMTTLGIICILSWEVKKKDRRIYVMLEKPHHMNINGVSSIAVGISRPGYTQHSPKDEIFQLMMNGDGAGEDIGFQRIQLQNDIKCVTFRDCEFEVSASMGNASVFELNFRIRPADTKELTWSDREAIYKQKIREIITRSAIQAGKTVQGKWVGSLIMEYDERVVCGLQVENWTKYTLEEPGFKPDGGTCAIPPGSILPAMLEVVVFHSKNVFEGTWGTLSWRIKEKNRYLFVMFSAPGNFVFYDNTLCVGFSKPGKKKPPANLFDQMYSKKFNRSKFMKKKYTRTSGEAIILSADDLEVEGTMSCTHKCAVKITVRPKDLKSENLAPSVRGALLIENVQGRENS